MPVCVLRFLSLSLSLSLSVGRELRLEKGDNIGLRYVDNRSASAKMTEFIDASKVREFHFAIFPEEYDFQADSVADLAARKRGESPMSSQYLEQVNERRLEFGFEPINGVDTGFNSKTYDWVLTMLRDGRDEELKQCIARTNTDVP